MKKTLFMILTVLGLLLLLAGCGKETVAEATTTALGSTAATEQSTTAPVKQEIVLVADGKAQYTIVRDEDLSTDAPGVTQCQLVLNEIQKLTGAKTPLGTDWRKKGTEPDAEKKEILVGYTDHPETAQVMADMSYGDWAVRAVGNKIILFGYDAASLSAAVSSFNRALRAGVSEDGKSITLSAEALEAGGTKNSQLTALPVFEGGEFGAYYGAAVNCDEIIVRKTTSAMYEAYLQKLADAGFVKYTDHKMGDNLFATYTNAKYTVTAGYYAYEESVRLLIEPLAPAVGLASDNVYTPVTTTQLTMLGQEHIDDKGEQIANGQSMLIRLADGRFIIIDGGYNRTDVGQELIQAMRDQSADYAKSDKDIKIAAWILTHVHSDHMGALLHLYKNLGDIKVERLLVSYLTEAERQRALTSTQVKANWGETEGTGANHVPTVAKALGAELHYVRTGQVYHFADVTCEVLYTIESYAPKVCNALNTTSAVMRFDLAGTTYLSTGDATGDALEVCAEMYGDYLKADIVQVAHHGSTTYNNDKGVMDAYKLANAATVLWPRGYIRYDVALTASRHVPLRNAPNHKEDFVAGLIGDRVVMPMPYTAGNAVETRVK